MSTNKQLTFVVYANDGTEDIPRLRRVGSASATQNNGIEVELKTPNSDTNLVLLPALDTEQDEE